MNSLYQHTRFSLVANRAIKLALSLIFLAFSGMLFFSCQASKAGTAKKGKPLRVLVVGGGSSHDFDRWYKQVDVATLSQDGFAAVRYTSNTDSIADYLAAGIDVLYLVTNQNIKNARDRQAIQAFADAGKGLVIGHAGMWYNWKEWPEYNQQLAGGGSRGHDRYGAYQVKVDNTQHPVMKAVEASFTLRDERYYYMADPAGPGVEVLASSSVAGSDKIYPSVFVVRHPRARIVGLALGHDGESHNIANYQHLLRNAVAWVGRK